MRGKPRHRSPWERRCGGSWTCPRNAGAGITSAGPLACQGKGPVEFARLPFRNGGIAARSVAHEAEYRGSFAETRDAERLGPPRVRAPAELATRAAEGRARRLSLLLLPFYRAGSVSVAPARSQLGTDSPCSTRNSANV